VEENVSPIKVFNALPHQDTLNIELVLQTVGKGFHHNEILCRTKPENSIGLNFYQLRTAGCLLFKRQSSQRYVYSNTLTTFEKQHPVLKSKRPAIFYPGLEYFQKRIDVCFLATEAREECEVHIASEPWFAPVLNGQPANKTKPPTAPLAFTLHVKCHATKFIHEALNLLKIRCCSTKPDV
jgi:hypothetical protein